MEACFYELEIHVELLLRELLDVPEGVPGDVHRQQRRVILNPS